MIAPRGTFYSPVWGRSVIPCSTWRWHVSHEKVGLYIYIYIQVGLIINNLRCIYIYIYIFVSKSKHLYTLQNNMYKLDLWNKAESNYRFVSGMRMCIISAISGFCFCFGIWIFPSTIFTSNNAAIMNWSPS